MKEALILVGHGGVPRDFDMAKVRRLAELERARRQANQAVSVEERELDLEIRNWPRTKENDPYKFGVEDIAAAIAGRYPGKVAVAYNEFCAPSIERAVDSLVAEGAGHITLLTTMFTRGGSHSEVEIPEEIEALKRKYPNVKFNYPWPFPAEKIAEFLLAQIR